MQRFVCPRCGSVSRFNPYVESGRCPSCGFEPPKGEALQEYLDRSQPPVPWPSRKRGWRLRAVVCDSCGADLGDDRPTDQVCPFCRSDDIQLKYTYTDDRTIILIGLAAGTAVLLGLARLGIQRGWSEDVVLWLGPVVGALVAILVIAWLIGRRRSSRRM